MCIPFIYILISSLLCMSFILLNTSTNLFVVNMTVLFFLKLTLCLSKRTYYFKISIIPRQNVIFCNKQSFWNLSLFQCTYRSSNGGDSVLDPDQSGIQNVTVDYYGYMAYIKFVRSGYDQSDISLEGSRKLTLVRIDLLTNKTTTIASKETSLKRRKKNS